MTYSYDLDHVSGIIYPIDDPPVPLADSVFVVAGEFFRTVRPGILSERLDATDDAREVGFRNRSKLFLRAFLDPEAIRGHPVSDL